MELARMQQQLMDFSHTLFSEGWLDEQFAQLQQLQDASNPNFVEEVVNLYIEDSDKILTELADAMEADPTDFRRIDAIVHQFKGSSSSIGALRVKRVCVSFRQHCETANRDGCVQILQQLQREFALVRSKLETLMQLEHEIMNAGGTPYNV